MNIEPDSYDLIQFTKGKFETMSRNEQNQAIAACKLHLEDVRRREQEREHRRAWEKLCPLEYRNSSRERLPNLEKFDQVQTWQYGPKGLVLLGPTRRGKTRAAWSLLKRLHFDERRSITAFNPMDLKLAVAKTWQDPEEAESWIGGLRGVQVLFIDDLDTIKFTEAVEETIYDIFESRPMDRSPVIVTVNRSGRELAARMNTNGRGAKIVERIRESCEVIDFS
jgi:DNA replication protein DnaC